MKIKLVIILIIDFVLLGLFAHTLRIDPTTWEVVLYPLLVFILFFLLQLLAHIVALFERVVLKTDNDDLSLAMVTCSFIVPIVFFFMLLYSSSTRDSPNANTNLNMKTNIPADTDINNKHYYFKVDKINYLMILYVRDHIYATYIVTGGGKFFINQGQCTASNDTIYLFDDKNKMKIFSDTLTGFSTKHNNIFLKKEAD